MSDQGVSRRNFMIRAIVAVFAFIGAVLTIPLAGFGILPVLKRKEPGWSDAGSYRDLPTGEPQERRFFEIVKKGWQEEKVERAVWIVRRTDGGITAFSPNCPHLGCGYRWVPQDQQFKCPCHASVFDITGKVLSGPAPRPLDTIPTKVEDGKVFVKFEVFQVGTSKKMVA